MLGSVELHRNRCESWNG